SGTDRWIAASAAWCTTESIINRGLIVTDKPRAAPAKRGFAGMQQAKQRDIASAGGLSVPGEKRSFYRDRKLARQAGSIGGQNVAPEDRAFTRDPALASAAGRLGGRPRKNR